MPRRFEPSHDDSTRIVPDLTIVDIENSVGSRLMLVELGLAQALIVEGRYRLLRLLGRGARGLVCLAYDSHLRREVALKLYPAHEPGPVAQEVATEAQALARLRHPNIVGVYDFGDASLVFDPADLDPRPDDTGSIIVPCFFMTMEYVRGQSLRRWLATGSPGRRHVLEVFAQAGEGLAHAHEAGVVHRDFKPENVMLADDGRVLVVDFGFASRRPGTLEQTTVTALVRWQPPQIVGTPEYMAPEARVGESKAPGDQYSFTVSLHEALIGALPPESAGGYAYIEQHRFPAAVARVLNRGLAADPRQRYANMRELLAELPRRWDDQWRWQQLDDEPSRKRQPPWLLIGLGAAVVVGGLGIWTGARLFGADAPTTSSEPLKAAASRDPCDALEHTAGGRWQLETLDLWDYHHSRRRVRGRYDLDIERVGADCRFEAKLSKTGSSLRSFNRPLVGGGPVELRAADEPGTVELIGDWSITDDKRTQRLEFTLVLDDDGARGDYKRHVRSPDGVERVGMAGPAYAARWGTSLDRVDSLAELPCASQCRVLCAGSEARKKCQHFQCATPSATINQCGAPGPDFVDPYTTNKMLSELEDGEWRAINAGRACEELPPIIAGQWSVWVRLDTGEARNWTLQLEAWGCSFIGNARSEGERHEIIADIDVDGMWLVRDRDNPRALAWAMKGWEFALGSSGGASPGTLSAYKRN